MPTYIPTSFYSVLPIFSIAPIIASFFNGKITKLTIILVFTLLFILELISIYFSGGYIDYQFFVNLNINDIIAGLFIFKSQAALCIGVFLLVLFLSFWLSAIASRYINQWIRLIVILLFILPLCTHDGPLKGLSQIYQIVTAKQTDFDKALIPLGLTPYTTHEKLTAQAGKNIIVISLESFEQGFLTRTSYAPKLEKLSKQYTFYPHMPMGLGSSWTTASMYTYMTGLPFLFGGYQTTPLNDSDATQITTLGDILNKAGYNTRYVGTYLDFANMGHIISLFGIKTISEDNYPNQYQLSAFGLYDHDLFELSKVSLNELRKQGKPFALFISTISTHAPSGLPDPNMKPFIAEQSDSMEFTARSLDYNLDKFIQYLEMEGFLENTVLYIFPDHLLMGVGTETIAKLGPSTSRQLYLLTNATAEQLRVGTDKTIYQIDLPRLILNGSGIKTNVVFLTDTLAEGTDKIDFIQKHIKDIASLNSSAKVTHQHNQQ